MLEYIDQPIANLGGQLNVPADQLRAALLLLVSFVLGIPFKMLKNPTLRHGFGLVTGVILQYILYREGSFLVLICSIIAYFLTRAFHNSRTTGAIVVFIYAIIFCSGYHIYRMIVDYGGWRMDSSVILMMLTPKITSVAWCYRDGGLDKEKLSQDQYNRRIVEFPGLFKYMSYVYFYPAALVGPAFEYNDFIDFIELKGDYQNIPSTVLPALTDLVGGFFQVAILILLSPYFEPRDQWKPHFTEKPLLRRFFDVTGAAYVIKAKYYAGFLFANANCTMAGLSYNGVDSKTNKPQWDRVFSIKVKEYELADNPRTQFESWNRSVQIWLKRYVFLRIVNESELKSNPKKASFAANASFMVSALWHGFYPYYYVTFLLFFMIQQFGKTLYNCGDYFKAIPRPIQYFIRWFIMNMLVNTTLVAFTLLEFDKVAEFAKSIYYFPWIAITSFYILGKFMVPPKRKGVKKE